MSCENNKCKKNNCCRLKTDWDITNISSCGKSVPSCGTYGCRIKYKPKGACRPCIKKCGCTGPRGPKGAPGKDSTVPGPTGPTGPANAWLLEGNTGITAGNFIGPINDAAFIMKTNNQERMVVENDGRVRVGYSFDNSPKFHVENSGNNNHNTARFNAYEAQNNIIGAYNYISGIPSNHGYAIGYAGDISNWHGGTVNIQATTNPHPDSTNTADHIVFKSTITNSPNNPNSRKTYGLNHYIAPSDNATGEQNGVQVIIEGGNARPTKTSSNYGVKSVVKNHTKGNNFAVFGEARNSAGNWAGFFIGDVALAEEGNKLFIKEGSDASMGLATLGTNGIAVVNTNAVTPNSRIFVTRKDFGAGGIASLGFIKAFYVSPGIFHIQSSNINDRSVVSWLIVEPGY